MAILDKNRLYAGYDDLAAGVDAGRRASLIEENQCWKARDTVFRGGVPATRPGFPQLDLEFEHEIYYGPAGRHIGPSTVTDGIITFADTHILLSDTVEFTPLDIGSFIESDLIDPGTTIASVQSAVQATMDVAAAGAAAGVTFTITRRTNPTSFQASFVGTSITGVFANFSSADVGRVITGGGLPAGTFITRVANSLVAYYSGSPLSGGPFTFTIAERVANKSSSEAFAFEPFQTACYYAPSLNNECIMATFGGRLFQVTPSESVARIREVPLGVEPHVGDASFGDGVTATSTSFVSASAGFTGYDVGISITGTNIPADTIISSVVSPVSVVLSHATTGTGSARSFVLHKRITLSGGRNRRSIPLNYMIQADRFLIVQDGEAKPIIFEGTEARRATKDEVPVGKVMAYGTGRLVVTRDRSIFFGDLFGSHAGDPAESILKFTETTFLSEGGGAETPTLFGNITAAAFVPSQDTATGQGELLVFTEHGACSFDLHLARDQWKNSVFQQNALINSTARGHRGVVIINGDLWIRSDEGWRAYRQARAQATGWYQLPQSIEVSPWTDLDTQSLLAFGSGVYIRNRLLVTSNAVPNEGRLYHSGLLSLDFDVLSAFGQATRPAWDGHWGKLKILQLVSGSFKGRNRAFAFALDEDDATQIYEISADDPEDFDGPITSEIEFKSYDFKSPFNEKNLYAADLWLDEVVNSTSMELWFRPDSAADYIEWKTFDPVLSAGGAAGEVTAGVVPTKRKGWAVRTRAGKPTEECDDYSGRMNRRGYEFQPRLRWTGHAAIRRMRLHALQVEEDPKATC